MDRSLIWSIISLELQIGMRYFLYIMLCVFLILKLTYYKNHFYQVWSSKQIGKVYVTYPNQIGFWEWNQIDSFLQPKEQQWICYIQRPLHAVNYHLLNYQLQQWHILQVLFSQYPEINKIVVWHEILIENYQSYFAKELPEGLPKQSLTSWEQYFHQ